MEVKREELAALEMAVSVKSEVEIVELADLQLALVGGGVGDILLG